MGELRRVQLGSCKRVSYPLLPGTALSVSKSVKRTASSGPDLPSHFTLKLLQERLSHEVKTLYFFGKKFETNEKTSLRGCQTINLRCKTFLQSVCVERGFTTIAKRVRIAARSRWPISYPHSLRISRSCKRRRRRSRIWCRYEVRDQESRID